MLARGQVDHGPCLPAEERDTPMPRRPAVAPARAMRPVQFSSVRTMPAVPAVQRRGSMRLTMRCQSNEL